MTELRPGTSPPPVRMPIRFLTIMTPLLHFTWAEPLCVSSHYKRYVDCSQHASRLLSGRPPIAAQEARVWISLLASARLRRRSKLLVSRHDLLAPHQRTTTWTKSSGR